MTQSSSLESHYRRVVANRVLVLLGTFLATSLILLLDISLGSSRLSLFDLLRSLIGQHSLTQVESIIVWDVRMPSALLALLVGAALGLAGAQLQTVLHNPLASPFTLGVSSAATLGASVAIVFGSSLLFPLLGASLSISLLAFVFSMGACALILLMARWYDTSAEMMILFGIAMVFVCNALVALIQYLSEADAVQEIVFWNVGSLSRAKWESVRMLGLVLLASLPFSWRWVWPLTVLSSGEQQARSAGVDTGRLRIRVILHSCLLASLAVSFVGAIGFIGLVAPHMARLSMGQDHRFYLPGSILAGGLVMLLSSLLGKLILPGAILPIGIVTALVGIPLFFALIFSQRRVH